MPIRTHRGRAAVYRRLWGWPLRSPKHLVTAVIVLAALATTIGILLPEPPPARIYRDGAARVPQHNSAPAAPTTTTARPPTFKVPRTPPPPTPPNPQGLAVVDAWGRQWANHPPGTAAPQWVARLRPHTTDEFITVMASVDPANVPATAITGPPAALRSTASSMDVRLPTNAGDIEVLVINTPQGWRVSGYDKVS